jgi:hypothetical protein
MTTRVLQLYKAGNVRYKAGNCRPNRWQMKEKRLEDAATEVPERGER